MNRKTQLNIYICRCSLNGREKKTDMVVKSPKQPFSDYLWYSIEPRAFYTRIHCRTLSIRSPASDFAGPCPSRRRSTSTDHCSSVAHVSRPFLLEMPRTRVNHSVASQRPSPCYDSSRSIRIESTSECSIVIPSFECELDHVHRARMRHHRQ